MEIFARDIVASLPIEKRRDYQFIESVENMLAKQSETKEQFLNQLREHSLHRQAARRFNMSLDETLKLMHEIEDEINKKLEIKEKHTSGLTMQRR
jgi:Cu/Ag efflux pump CusA